MKIVLFIFLPFLVFYGQTKSSDTLVVKRKAIVFFKPSPVEYELLQQKDSLAIFIKINDFNRYSNLAISFLRKKGIKYYITDKNFVLFFYNNGEESFLFERRREKDFIGVILSDKNKEPLVKSGIVTDVELFSLMEEYYTDKQFYRQNEESIHPK